jgi:hypothetical protein
MAGAAVSAERFVDNSGAPPCSDSSSRDSSPSEPWCTINYAVRRAVPGDVVYVKNGTYREDLYIGGKNGGGSYITFRNYPGHSPVIRGGGVESGRNKISESSFIRFIGFTITNFQHGVYVEKSDNIILEKLRVHDVGQEAVRIRMNSSFVTLQDSTIHDTRKWQFNGEGVYIGTSSSQQPSSPPYDNTHDVLVKNNTIYNTSDECVEAKEGTYNVTIDGNVMRDCLLDPAISSPGFGGVEVMEHRKYYGANPNHVIKNNIIRMAKTAIGVHTGATVFNNVIYGQTGPYRGISIDNADSDKYPRHIYHNTIDVPEQRAVVSSGGALSDIRNNIGPRAAGNIAARDDFFVSKAAADYRLVAGSAPIDAGVDLTAMVARDIEGGTRSRTPPPDLGAYEFGTTHGADARAQPRR